MYPFLFVKRNTSLKVIQKTKCQRQQQNNFSIGKQLSSKLIFKNSSSDLNALSNSLDNTTCCSSGIVLALL